MKGLSNEERAVLAIIVDCGGDPATCRCTPTTTPRAVIESLAMRRLIRAEGSYVRLTEAGKEAILADDAARGLVTVSP